MPRSIQIGAYWSSFILAVLYVPFINGAATSPRFVLLAFGSPFCLFACYKQTNFTISHLIGLLFLILALCSLLWTNNYNEGFYLVIQFIILAEAFVLGSYLVSLRDVFAGLALGICVSTLIVLMWWNNAGLFINVNTLAEIAVIVLVGVWIYELWEYVPGLAIAVFINESRGAILVSLIMFGGWLYFRFKILAIVYFASIISIGLISIYSKFRISSLNIRLALWDFIFKELSWLGHGIGSFFSAHYYGRYAHNDLFQIVFDLGLIGGLIAILFFCSVIKENKPERFILIACLMVSCFDFPLYLPVSSFVTFLVCGFLVRNGSSIFGQYYNSRI